MVGEVRNIVFGIKDRRDYAVVASGRFFTTGKDSIVVPLRFMKVSQERGSFFLPIPQSNSANARSGLQVALGRCLARRE
jgi:hypothetical protein